MRKNDIRSTFTFTSGENCRHFEDRMKERNVSSTLST